MNFLAPLFLVSALAAPLDRLVLVTGEEVPISGAVEVSDGTVVFHSPGGTLYSIPASEIDMAATEQRAETEAAAAPLPEKPKPFGVDIRVSEEEKRRLLQEIAKNRSQHPASLPQVTAPAELPAPAPAASRSDGEEWAWRNRAREFEEALRQRQEELDLLLREQRQLEDQVLGFLSLGYKADQFSYQVFRLQLIRDSLDRARLEVDRAQRALEQFRDDARRQGILPGWLR